MLGEGCVGVGYLFPGRSFPALFQSFYSFEDDESGKLKVLFMYFAFFFVQTNYRQP